MTIEFGDARLSDRFWSKVVVVPDSDCWGWTSTIKGNGTKAYPHFWINKTTRAVKPVLVETFYPDKDMTKLNSYMVCGDKICVNPNHVGFKARGPKPRPKREKHVTLVKDVIPQRDPNISAFGDLKREEVWRPTGWSPTPRLRA